jgi:hypothetical protein
LAPSPTYTADARVAGRERLRPRRPVYGLLQLSDKSGGRDFDQTDETNIRELAALVGETLDAVRLAAQ